MHEGGNGSTKFVLDLMEPERPKVDRAVLDFVKATVHDPADFVIRSDGVCRLNPEMARMVAAGSARRSSAAGVEIGSIETTGSTKVTVGKMIFVSDEGILGKIVGGFVFRDTVASVSVELARVEADVAKISSIRFTNTGTPALRVTAARSTSDAKAIRKIAAPYVLDVRDTNGSWTATRHGNKLTIDDIKGRDTITGHGDSETLIFAASFGDAVITDFHDHLSGATRDKIDLAHSEFLSQTDLKNDAAKSRANIVISGSGNDRLTLDDITVAKFDDAIGDFKLIG
jgi:hypothetical protein